jgi:hypothetical protein
MAAPKSKEGKCLISGEPLVEGSFLSVLTGSNGWFCAESWSCGVGAARILDEFGAEEGPAIGP